MRISPDVRIRRSGSGHDAVYSRRATDASSISAGCSRPACTSSPSSRAARAISARELYEMQRLRSSSVPPAVSWTMRSSAARALGASRAISPRTWTRAPRARSSATSFAMYSSRSCMSASISSAGRCQFSWLNAKSVSTPTSASRQPSIASRTAAIPAACPSGRGSERSRAHRPLPSMMMATWAGTAPWRRIRSRRSSLIPSNFHDLRFFDVNQLIELLDVLVVQLLHVLLRPPLLVLRGVLQLLEPGDRFGPRVTHGDAALLGELVHHLDQLTAALLRERRQWHPNQVALRSGVQAEVRLANGLLDGRRQRLVERLDREQPRLGRGDHPDLVERDLAAVRFDPHEIEQGRRGLPAPDRAELPLGRLHRLVHRLAGVLGQLGNRGHLTMVPTRSPCRTRATARGWLMLNTMIGSWLARQRPNALPSMTA